MALRSGRCGLRRGALALAVAASVLSPVSRARVRATVPGVEVRALWVVRTTLVSPAAVDSMVASAKAGGFNTLLVQVRGRADAYDGDGLELRPLSLSTQPPFDPLAATIERAHRAGMSVHAWINVNLIAGASELPMDREHVVYQHPDWLMVPRALGEDLAGADPTSPQYLGRLARYARSQPDQVEGLYLSPVAPAARAYTAGIVRDIVRRYDVDGVHLDYLRYPTDEFDYSRTALNAFRQSVVADLSSSQRQTYETRLKSEPLIYTQAFPERWRSFRMDQLTSLVTELRDAVKAERAAAIVSVAVVPDPAEASTHRLQDWRVWLTRNLIDVVCPMAYTTDGSTFAAQIQTARDIAGAHPVWAGIGAYRLSSSEIIANVQATRRLGVGGFVLFSYDSLTGPAHGLEYLAEVGRALSVQ